MWLIVKKEDEIRRVEVCNAREFAYALARNRENYVVFDMNIEVYLEEAIEMFRWLSMVERSVMTQRLVDSLVICMFRGLGDPFDKVISELKNYYELGE